VGGRMIRHSSMPRDSLRWPNPEVRCRTDLVGPSLRRISTVGPGMWKHPENCHLPVSYIAVHPQEWAHARRTKKSQGGEALAEGMLLVERTSGIRGWPPRLRARQPGHKISPFQRRANQCLPPWRTKRRQPSHRCCQCAFADETHVPIHSGNDAITLVQQQQGSECRSSMPGAAPVSPVVMVPHLSEQFSAPMLPVIMSGDEHGCHRQHERTHNDCHCFTHRNLHCRPIRFTAGVAPR
jgi:hypothetical protein